MRVDLRPETPEDEPFLYRLITTTVAEELMAWAWDEKMREPLLRMQYNGRQQSIRAGHPNAEHSIIRLDGNPAGRIVIDRQDASIHLVDIAILAEHRGAGMGTAIIRELLVEADRAGKPVTLNVNATNRAAGLYERLGFRRTGGSEVQHYMERPAISPS
jgi:ribosomal protein S18 acetylase RimI-like enzyme